MSLKTWFKSLRFNQPTVITAEILRGIVTWSGQTAASFIDDGYAGNDIVYSIIKLITNKAKIAPWSVFKIKDEAKYQKLQAKLKQPHLIKNWKEISELKEQALEVYKDDQRLNELLKYPNEEDTWSDLIEAWGGFKLATGNSYIYAEMIGAGKNSGKPLTLTAMPSQYMSIIADISNMPRNVLGYQLYIGQYWKFEKTEILHDKYFNPRWNASGMELYGMSPLLAASKLITRSNEAKTAAVANLQNGGPAGVLYTNDNRLSGDVASAQAVALKNKLNEFSGSKNKNKIATSGYPIGWQQIGLSNVDLAIIESEKWDMRGLCNVFGGVPSALLNDPENKTYNNLSESEKALTVRCALPLLTEMCDNLNRKLQTDWGYKGQNIVVGFDISSYPELQEDKAAQVNWLAAAWWLPIERKYEIMGEKIPDYVDEATRQTIYAPTNLLPIEEINETGDTDPNDADPYNKPVKQIEPKE